MIEVYLFLGMFPVQILGMSVLYPVLLTRRIRTGLKDIPAERLAELYPGVDVGQAHAACVQSASSDSHHYADRSRLDPMPQLSLQTLSAWLQ